MKTTKTSGDELGQLQLRFEQWRQHKSTPGQRIPEPLWQAATELARQQGVSRIAQLLRLNYKTLKERANSQASLKPVSRPEPFIELALPGPAPVLSLLEVVNRQGARLSLQLPPPSSQQLADLVAAFLK